MDTMTGPPPGESGWRQLSAGPYMDRIGPLWARSLDGHWLYGLRANATHLNPIDVAHGGLLQSLADHAMSLAAWEAAGRVPCLSVDACMQFLAPAQAGDWLTASARLRHRAGGLVFMQADIHAAARPVLSAMATFKAARPHAARPSSTET